MLVKAFARLKYVSIPPRKMRLVADMVKGMPVEKALNILNFTPKIAAHHIAKTLKSAAANALSTEGTDHLKPEDLKVSNIIVDAAPTHKRIRFQSMGRVFRYKKRFCHLTIQLEGEAEAVEVKKGASKKAAKKAEAKDEKADAKSAAKTAGKKTATKAKKPKSKNKKADVKSPGGKVKTSSKAGVKKTSTTVRKGNR